MFCQTTIALVACCGLFFGPVQPFPMKQVRLLDGPFREAMLRNKAYLLSREPDRFLHNFRSTAGLPSTAQPYTGWEGPDNDVRGHCTGHYLSACALTYASTGDEKLKARCDEMVRELTKCQEALRARGSNAGYLSAFPESHFDRLEARQPVFVPWYTIHKIMAGLLDVYQYCDNQDALTIVKKMADWVKFRIDRLTFEQMQAILEMEFGGMNEVLANLYAITRNPYHLGLAKAFDHQRIFDPLAEGVDQLTGLHANTQIPKIVGAIREYELTGEQRYRDIAEFFWERVALHRSYANGGHSDNEHFFPVHRFTHHLTPVTTETCNTYNMLKLTRHLFALEPSARTMDFYERALYNHILASQDPKTGMFGYFMPFKPGHFKYYSRPDDSFWCCVGTGMENHTKYGDTVYFHDADSLYVNLFIASELNWAEKGLTVRQETKFPETDTTQLTFKCEKPLELAVKIRCPEWTVGGAILTLNGEKLEARGVPGSYVALERTWKDGDRLEIQFPMSLRVQELPYDPHTIAVLYGPILLAGQLGTEGMPSPYTSDHFDFPTVPAPQVPMFICDDGNIVSRIEPVEGELLTFRTKNLGQPEDVTLKPFYQTHHQRYAVYWKTYSPSEWEQLQREMAAAETRRLELESRLVDVVRIGDEESEKQHNLQGENTEAGRFTNRVWRHATGGGWFSWDMKVIPDQPQTLTCTHWGSDVNRTFDVLIEGRKIATVTLNKNKPDEFFDVEYPIPPDLLQGKSKITVRFQAPPGGMAGGVFGCAIYRLVK